MSEQMNIYLINFTQHDAGLSAVVAADCRTSAENMVNEQIGPESIDTLFHIGVANVGAIPRIICRESLV